ncbi:hypothetical protein [Dyella sp. GSA-30]|uniref:hypothetical protein n=1 Tax=Dyella sp. GSA-30 TaxID=2994496 RepID=UPI002491AC06|nr:hypothetical protein [Dyella sp. GSA-30]BDU21583.1 hypothetical protein DYGSA30_30400 [Dyella sp. GSA-30]
MSQPFVSMISFDLSENLRREVVRFVRIKHEIDDWAHYGKHRWAIPEGLIRETSSNPWDFVRTLIPFIGRSDSQGMSAWVPTELVIGDSHNWRFEHLNATDREHRREIVMHPDRAVYGDHAGAEYVLISGLGIVASHEGKNRVRFLAAMGEEFIPAFVTKCDYPAAERIRTYEIEFGDREEVWAILDDRYLHRLSAPGLVLPLLQAYGVRHSRSWPGEMPKPREVMGYMDTMQAQTSERLAHRPLDLEDVRREQLVEETGTDRVSVVFTEIATIHIDLRTMAYALGTIVVCILAIGLIPSLRASGIIGFLVGITCCQAIFVYMPVFKARRCDLFDWPQRRHHLRSRKLP